MGQFQLFTSEQHRCPKVSYPNLLRALGPLLLAIIVCSGLLLVTARHPYARVWPAQAWLRHSVGTHELENTAWLQYAYTNGAATVTFPEVGVGRFLTTLQLGAPPDSRPVFAQIGAATQQLDLGLLSGVRTYQLMVPATPDGQFRLRLQSDTQFVGSDPRPLGLLVGQIAVHSLGVPRPAPLQLAAALLTLCCFWLAISQLHTALPQKAGWLVLVGVVLAAPHALTRGDVALQPWWLGFGAAAVVSMLAWRAERWSGQTTRVGAMLACVVWLVALWFVAVAGLVHSDGIARQWRDLSVSFGAPNNDLGTLVWRTALAWVNWDGVHYQAIAETGYTFRDQRWPTIAFFPLYPLLIRGVLTLTSVTTPVAALLVAQLALLSAIMLLYHVVRHDFGEIIAYRTVIFLLSFPTAFFFVAGYTESLALLLTIAAVWAMRRRRWWLAGMMGGLLALTRVPGVLLAPVLALVYLQHKRWRWQAIRADLLAVLLPPLGLGLFLLYQWRVFGTPWAFLVAQQSWKNGLAPPWHIPQLIIAALAEPSGWLLASLQLAVWLSVLGLALFALWRLPLEYGLTGLLLIVPAYCANIRDSLPRHVLISFPIFVVLAQIELPLWLRWLIVLLLLPLLALLTVLFVNGFWIA